MGAQCELPVSASQRIRSGIDSNDAAKLAALPELPALCTATESASALRTSTRTIKRMVASGRLRAAKLALGGSSRLLIPRAELERLVAESLL